MSVRATNPALGVQFDEAFLADAAAACFDAGAKVAGTDGLDAASVVTVGYLHDRVGKGLSADALDAHVDGLARAGLAPSTRTADAAMFYEHDLTAPLREEPFVKPQRARALLANIPTIAVDPGQRYFTVRYAEHEANAAWMRQGDTTPPLGGVTRSEMSPREINWIWSGAPTDWLLRRRDGFAGRDNETKRRESAVLGVEQVMNTALLAPDAGVTQWGLQPGVNAVPVARGASSLASAVAATGDDVLEDLDEAALEISEASDGTMPAPDTVMVGRILLNTLRRKYNFAAGGPGAIGPAFEQILAMHGITQVQIADELNGFAGAGTGAMVFYNRASDLSLRHALGMRPAPVHTYTGARGDVTVYAGCTGGIVVPNGQAAYIRTYTL